MWSEMDEEFPSDTPEGQVLILEISECEGLLYFQFIHSSNNSLMNCLMIKKKKI